MKKLALTLSALALLVGCGKSDSGPGTPAQTCATGATCLTTLTASSAPDYYKQFQYQTVGDCKNPSAMRFTWLTLKDRVVVGKTTDGNDIVAEINLYLDQSGGYTGEYQENTQKRIEEGFYETIDSKNKRDLTGKWATTDTHILIDNLGQGDAATSGNWPAVQITVGDSDLNATLKGQKLVFTNIRSLISKDGKAAADVCAEAKQ